MIPERLQRLEERPLPGGLRLFVADSARARLVGLALLDELPAGCALLLRRCRSMHTLGMRFAIDLVFLDPAGRPLELRAGVRPGRFARCRQADAVVETATGDGATFARALARVK